MAGYFLIFIIVIENVSRSMGSSARCLKPQRGKNMQIVLKDSEYSYVASTKVITLAAPYDGLSVGQIVRIVNLTTGSVFYEAATQRYPISLSGADITHTYDDSNDADTDKFQIIVDIGGSSSNPIHVSTDGAVASTVDDGRQVVATPGTAVALAASTTIKEVTITAELTNTDLVCVGGSTVVAALATQRGTPLYPGDSVTLKSDDLAEVFIDAIVATDGVVYTYLA